MDIKNNKASGLDNLQAELFKYGGKELKTKMTEIVTKVQEVEEIPSEWKKGIICPLYKKGDKINCRNYRGITLLNTVYKLLSKILYCQLLPYVQEKIEV